MKYIIYGRTQLGQVFRPSDWADRLCSVFAHYDPVIARKRIGHGAHSAAYSKYLMPTLINDIRSVVLDDEIGTMEPQALDFVLNFASDNNLVIEPCLN
jgi:hypothetical protein